MAHQPSTGKKSGRTSCSIKMNSQIAPFEKKNAKGDRNSFLASIDSNVAYTQKKKGILKECQQDDIADMETDCPVCGKNGVTKVQQVTLPDLKEVIIMKFTCDFCGYKSNEVKSGGKVAEKGRKITLHVQSEDDLKRDVLKSDTATLSIPEVDLELAPGTLGGFFSSVEGTLMMVRDQLQNLPQAEFEKGDSASTEKDAKTLPEFVKELEELMEVKRPFTFILDDPLANIYIQNPREHLPPPDNVDPKLINEEYVRSYEQDEDLGFHQMNVDD